MTRDRIESPISCAEVREYLPAFLADEISPADSRAIQDHLDACPGCRRFHGFEHAFDELLDRCLAPEAAPPELEARVRRSLREGNVVRTSRFGSLASRGWKRWAVAAAILVALVVPASVTYYDWLVVPDGLFVAGAERVMRGTLVCTACERAGRGIEYQRSCRAHGHHVGFLCDRSGLWELIENDETRPLISASDRIGDRVELRGVFMEDLRYVRVRSVHPLGGAETARAGL